jgi:hypothetical protein
MGKGENEETKPIDKRIGNEFWKARSSHGRDPIFKSPEELWEACQEYFEWVENNPLREERATQYQGVFVKGKVNKMRAMTIGGLCIFLDIDDITWKNYRERKDFFRVTKQVEQIIRDQKFSGAAADLLNANIIARDLGLKEATTNEHTGKDGGPLLYENVDQIPTAELIKKAGLDKKGE